MVDVLVVDDSSVVRRLVTSALESDPDVRVVATAANGRIALAKLEQHRTDVVTLDIEMPVMDGLETLREIRRRRPTLPVVMFSTVTERGGIATLEALAAGASDYVTKPSHAAAISESLHAVRGQLVPRIKALHEAARLRAVPVREGRGAGAPGPPALDRAGIALPVPRAPAAVDIVCIGCSTGGPEALSRVVCDLPASLAVPVVVVQHMPPLFTRLFAERLDRLARCQVTEATDGTPLRPGHVYIAPGDRHLELARAHGAVRVRLTDAAPENFCRPAVDVLFRSAARLYGAGALAVVLTGMGSDGRRGCEPLRAAGARVIVQDAATSVVWGMPGSVSAAGLATSELPLERIAGAVVDAVEGRGAPLRSAGA